jgi:glycine oxidase
VSTDVLVVGGGAVGLAAAWRVAREGASVRVLDASGTRGATWAAAGMLAPVSEAVFGEEELLRLNLAALARFPSFAAELEAEVGQDVGLRREGTLVVALDADDRTALSRLSAFRSSLGLVTEELAGSAARRLEPFLSPEVRGAVLASDDLSVNNRRYASALHAALAHRGVDVVAGRAEELLVEDGRAVGVRADVGELRADVVVLAAGSWSPTLPGLPPELVLPVRPVKGQILRLGPSPSLPAGRPVLTRTVRALVRGTEVYLVPREDGEVVVGATVEERGFDETVTVGAVHELLRDACDLVPVLTELALVECRAGLRPGTPDNGPLVGRGGLDGLVVATGHYRNGILLSALSADAVAALVAGSDPASEWKPFAADRFSTDSTDANDQTVRGDR